MSGSMVLRSSCPPWTPSVTAVWLPVTWAHTWIKASQITGFTLPGMMLEPGCTAGRAISASPQRGPLFMSRTSPAIFIRLAATAFTAPLAQTAASCEPCAAKWFRASTNGSLVCFATRSATRRANSGCVLSPVPTAVPPSASSHRSGSTHRSRAMPCSTIAA